MLTPSRLLRKSVSARCFALPRLLPLDHSFHMTRRWTIGAQNAETQQAGTLACAALGGVTQIEQMKARGMARFQGLDRSRNAAEDDSQLVIKVMGRGRCHRAGMIGFGDAFHAGMVADTSGQNLRKIRQFLEKQNDSFREAW